MFLGILKLFSVIQPKPLLGCIDHNKAIKMCPVKSLHVCWYFAGNHSMGWAAHGGDGGMVWGLVEFCIL